MHDFFKSAKFQSNSSEKDIQYTLTLPHTGAADVEIKKKTALSFIAVQATEVVKTCFLCFLKISSWCFISLHRANQPLENAHLKRMGFHSSNTPQTKPLVMKVPLHTLHQPKYRWEQNYYHLYEISNFPYCFCNRAILIIPKQGYTKWSQHFQVSTTGVRSIIKKLKESHRVQNEPGRGRKPKISKTLERKFANNCQDTIEWHIK